MKTTHKGFTVIEISLIIVIALTASIVFFMQKNSLQVAARDDKRKTAINAMYYALEKSYYPAHKSYPAVINAGVLSTIDPELFNDPSGLTVGATDSDYRYEPTNCNGEICEKYTLRSILENESDYVKTNSN